MDGPSAKKSTSFPKLVIRNIENTNDLKARLLEITKLGKDFEFDVSSCLKALLKSSDEFIVLLTVQAISELVKCEIKRETYAQKDIIEPILLLLKKEVTLDTVDLVKQCFRALGNLCCDCDSSRQILLESNSVEILRNIIVASTGDTMPMNEIKLFTCKTLLNYAIGGHKYSKSLAEGGIIECGKQILCSQINKEYMEDELISTVLLILSVINEHDTELLFEPELNIAVLNVLKDTTNVEVSELCLEHFNAQAQHDSVKTLLANEGGVNLVCRRLEQLIEIGDVGDMNDDCDVQAVLKQAYDLITIVLTGDEAMDLLYNNGVGEVYLTMVKWLDSTDYQMLTTATLAIGNFARRDDYCSQMMDNKIFDKVLGIFELYHGFNVRMQTNQNQIHPIDEVTIIKIEHATLSAMRNLTVPEANKRIVAAQGKAAPILINALPNVVDHHVAYKLLAAVRMLVDGQESVARMLLSSEAALAATARWGTSEHPGAAGESPRLIAWAIKLLPQSAYCEKVLQVDGCVSCLVNMFLASHSLMHNEAILALSLLAIQDKHTDKLTPQLISSEIGKHISVFIESNCAKMPIEVAENLLAFLDITSKNNAVVSDYKEAKVSESLLKFVEVRKDVSDELKVCINNIVVVINGNTN